LLRNRFGRAYGWDKEREYDQGLNLVTPIACRDGIYQNPKIDGHPL
jgi:hypothetical protein